MKSTLIYLGKFKKSHNNPISRTRKQRGSVVATLGVYKPSTAIFCKNISDAVRPIRLDWLCKDDFIRGIYKLPVMLKDDSGTIK